MPTLARGAAITLEDAFVLARALARHGDDPIAAWRTYEAERLPRARAEQLQARQQVQNNRMPRAPPPLSRDWIFTTRPASRSMQMVTRLHLSRRRAGSLQPAGRTR